MVYRHVRAYGRANLTDREVGQMDRCVETYHGPYAIVYSWSMSPMQHTLSLVASETVEEYRVSVNFVWTTGRTIFRAACNDAYDLCTATLRRPLAPLRWKCFRFQHECTYHTHVENHRKLN